MKKQIAVLTLSTLAVTMQARTLTGRVALESDSTAVAGAVCQIMTPSGPGTSTVSDADGRFSLDTDNNAQLSVQISMPGMSAAEIMIKNGKSDIALGTIYLSDAVQLGEVTATAQRTVSKSRTIIYPSQSQEAASSTTGDLFRKLVLVGLESNPISRTITVDGGTPVILIDGVPSTMDDLNALSPKDILRIEYSRFTPARYASGNNRGFLSITLKQRTDGGSVFAWGRSAVTTAFVDASLRSSYHQGKSQVTLSYVPSWRNYQKVYDQADERFIAPDFDVTLRSSDRNPFNYFSNDIKLKYDFTPAAGTVFSATLRTDLMTDGRRKTGTFDDSRLGTYSFNTKSKGKTSSPSLDLYFRRDFNHSNTIEAEVVATYTSQNYDRANRYLYADGTQSIYASDVDSRRRSLISEVSYTHNFGQRTQLSAGLQNTLSYSRNTYIDSDFRPTLTENHNYVFASLGQQIGNVYTSLSSGMKMFWTENNTNRRKFIRNLSSLEASWSAVPGLALQGAVRYSPSIPSLSALTDYAQQVTPYLVSNGNPNLKVAENLSSYGMISYTKGKVTVAYEANYSKIWNNMISDVSYLGNGRFLSQTINARSTSQMIHAAALAVQNLGGFGASLNAMLTRSNSVTESWNYSLTSFDASISAWYATGRWSFEYWRKFPGKSVSGYYVMKNENSDMLTASYAVNKNLKMSASWMYMFDKNGSRYPQWSHSPVNPSTTNRYIRDNSNMVVLSLTYNTNFGTVFKTASRTLNNTDNESSILKQ